MLNLIVPKRCAFCRAVTPDGLCDNCQTKLPWRLPCDAGGVVSPLCYKDTVRLALHRYKFRGFSGYAAVFAELMAQAVRDCRVEADVVTWVPCSFWRRWARGYDQSEKLAHAVAKKLGLPMEKLLRKKRNIKSQTKMPGGAARRVNVRDAFTAVPAAREKRILLIDDIVTSGATLNECRSILCSSGAKTVVFCTAAAR
jgi:ComF family protein